jgi:hypothetical protein
MISFAGTGGSGPGTYFIFPVPEYLQAGFGVAAGVRAREPDPPTGGQERGFR